MLYTHKNGIELSSKFDNLRQKWDGAAHLGSLRPLNRTSAMPLVDNNMLVGSLSQTELKKISRCRRRSCHCDPFLNRLYCTFCPLILFPLNSLSLSLSNADSPSDLTLCLDSSAAPLINSDEISRRDTSQRGSERNKHFRGKSNKVELGR